MSLMRRLIERAGEEGGEAWIWQCLDLPWAPCQEAPVGATTAIGGPGSSAAEVRMSVAEPISNEPASRQEEEDAGKREEVPCHRVRDPSASRSGAKRRRIPRRRHSPSPPAASSRERAASGGGGTSRGVARGAARASSDARVSRSSAAGSAGGVTSGVSRGGARGGASARQTFIPPQEDSLLWQQIAQPEVSNRDTFDLTGNPSNISQAHREFEEEGLMISQDGQRTQIQGKGELNTVPNLVNIAELLAKLAKDISVASSQARAPPTQGNSLMGVWAPSSGLLASEQSSDSNAFYHLARSQNLPETCLKEPMACTISPLGYHLSITVKDKIWRGEFLDILSLLPSAKEFLIKDKKEEDDRRRPVARSFNNWYY